jgi:hypothetical protein
MTLRRCRLEHHPHLCALRCPRGAAVPELHLGPPLQRRAPEPCRRRVEPSQASALSVAQHLPDAHLSRSLVCTIPPDRLTPDTIVECSNLNCE